jgi:hypothetical protein
MKRWKVAISLALVAAVAAPFVSGTYKARIVTYWYEPLTDKQLGEAWTNLFQCEELRGEKDIRCLAERDWMERGIPHEERSPFRYIGLNLAAALTGSIVTFGLAMIVPVLLRRYWKWLST